MHIFRGGLVISLSVFGKVFFSTGPLPRRFILKLTCVDRYHQSWGRAEYFQTRSGGCKFWWRNTLHSRPLAMSNIKGPHQGSRIEGNTVILAINAVCGVTSEKQGTLLRLCHQKAERAHLSKILNFEEGFAITRFFGVPLFQNVVGGAFQTF